MNIELKITTIKGKINNWLKDNREYKQFKKDYQEILNKIQSFLIETAQSGYNDIIIIFDNQDNIDYSPAIKEWFVLKYEYNMKEYPYYFLKDKYKKYLKKLFKVYVYRTDSDDRKEPKIEFSW